MDAKNLATFLRTSERVRVASGEDAVIIDFTTVVKDPQAPCMIAVILPASSGTFFLKMAGYTPMLGKHKAGLLEIVRSLKVTAPAVAAAAPVAPSAATPTTPAKTHP